MSEKSLFCGNNKPADSANLTEVEKKHMPVIECPDTVKAGEPFKVTIKVGEIPHVMQEAHSIQWIEVFSGENFKVRVDLTPVTTLPEVTVTLIKSGRHRTSSIRVIERCNLHGQWEAVKQIAITE
ncbi:MAG: class II SORL domain-containing protein [Candidatus Magnetominusculus sp. LBB02]|nr:class II SORL domain-containing protein [Candidatus Magnetominusculus sp. LBB02]